MNAIAQDKKILRELAKTIRAKAARRHGARAGERLAEHGLHFLAATQYASVSGFSAIGEEIDPAPLLLHLIGAGHPIGLPVMQGKGKPLIFRAWKPGDEMSPAVWGISEPLPTRPEVIPDILLVPLLAFDAAGYRLGYGGGFYDRTLDRLRKLKPITAVGIAYDAQRMDAVPHLDYDQPLDWVLTPSGPFKCIP